MDSSRRHRSTVALVAAGLLATGIGAGVARAASDTAGHTAAEQTVTGTNGAGFDLLGLGAGRPYVVREEAGAAAQPGRGERRRSLLYIGQLTDFQLADEESPSRVEFLDVPGPTSAAWRPQEALQPFVIDESIRQLNLFVPASPLPQGDGSRARMAFALTTGDSADNQERNEVEWTVRLLEGGTLDPNSGVDSAGCPLATDSAANYTGVQDYDDYPLGKGNTQFYDPDTPQGAWAAWPTYTGLMDRAQQSFTAAGLAVPSYVAFGNHDGLAQGNQKAVAAFEAIGTSCAKPTGGTALGSPPTSVMNVDPDVNRQYVSKAQYKGLHGGAGHQADAHGFAYVDPAEQAASDGAAGYYAWDPAPGFRLIALDTVAEGGVAGTSANGNIDDPQFQWLERELQAASAQDKLVVLYGHHPVRSLTDVTPDETPPACVGGDDGHGHDPNPGCDVDPRVSEPIHLGQDLVDLVARYPHVIAYVAGHTHENKITPFTRPDGSGWWGIETASEADWPQQNRLLEVMDNADGTLSIFGTPLDHAGPTGIPAADVKGTQVASFTTEELAAISRTFAFNDPHAGGGTNEGAAPDNAVELLVRDPRRSSTAGAAGVEAATGATACRDRGAPLSTVNRGRLRLTRRLVTISGRAVDAGACPSTTARAAASGRAAAAGRVTRVRAYLGREVRRGCRFLTARGGLSRRRSCRRPLGVLARVRPTRRAGSYTWLLRKRARLPRGRYFAFARARDAAGNLERLPRRGALVRLRVR